MDEKRIREALKDKQRIVLKIGSSSIIHEETGGADYRKLETLVRLLESFCLPACLQGIGKLF